jgi:hypothetical protein
MALPIKQQLTHPTRANLPKRTWKLIPHWGDQFGTTVHGTGNSNAGADAQMHANWQDSDSSGSGSAVASWVCVHAYVDDKQAIQTWPFDALGYHAGDGCENKATDFGCWSTLGIEGCEASSVDLDKMQINFAELIARVHVGDPAFDWGDGHTKGKFSTDELWQHIQVSQQIPPHHCPNWLLNKPNGWAGFMLQVDAALLNVAGITPPPPDPKLPAGMTDKLARALFGVVYDSNGARYSFNLDGSRSQRWLAHGMASVATGETWIAGTWPRLEAVYATGTGKGTKILQYSDGWLDDGQSKIG